MAPKCAKDCIFKPGYLNLLVVQLSSTARPAGAPAAAASSARSPVLTEFRWDFVECIDEMREFRKEMTLLRESFAAFTLRLDAVERRLELLERGQSQGDAARVVELELSISALRQQLNDRDQDALLSDIEVGHRPEEKGENTVHAEMVLVGRLGVPLEARDVVFAERVGARPTEAAGRIRRVVVRLASRHLRNELLRAARVRRAGLTAGSGFCVYVNKRLTGPNRQLFHRVREECCRLHWKYSWTRRGRIFARQEDGRPAFPFREEQDLEQYFGPGSVLDPVNK
ncbi:hypothetical protein ACJJTC_017035 [Scirpophaga incertulas]